MAVTVPPKVLGLTQGGRISHRSDGSAERGTAPGERQEDRGRQADRQRSSGAGTHKVTRTTLVPISAASVSVLTAETAALTSDTRPGSRWPLLGFSNPHRITPALSSKAETASIAGEPNSRAGLRRLHLRGDAASTDGVTRVGVGRLSRLFLSLSDVSTARQQTDAPAAGVDFAWRSASRGDRPEYRGCAPGRRGSAAGSGPPSRRGDAGLITTIVQNLVSNAL